MIFPRNLSGAQAGPEQASERRTDMQKRNWSFAGLLALALQIPPNAAAEPQHDPTIERATEAYRRAVLAGDAAAVAGTYKLDAVEMPPECPEIAGRAAIQRLGLWLGCRRHDAQDGQEEDEGGGGRPDGGRLRLRRLLVPVA
jgi:hypothetical protein